MICQRTECGSNRIAFISGKCSDLCSTEIGGNERNDYPPTDMGLKNSYGDYVELSWCLDCGQIQAEFPVPTCALERSDDQV